MRQPPDIDAFLAYSAYGYSNGTERLGFGGQWLDPWLGGHLLGNGHRLYSPALMRFYSPDAHSPFGAGGLSVYAYCMGDPVNGQDPSGRFPLFMAQRTGLSRLLKQFGLPKKDLKFLLKSLAKPEHKGKSLFVSTRKGNDFVTYEFSGDAPRISGKRLQEVVPFSDVVGTFFVKGDLYIRSPTENSQGIYLRLRGYERKDFASPTHTVIRRMREQPSTVPSQLPGLMQRRLALPNDYVDAIRL